MTSKAGTPPIVNLRKGNILNLKHSASYWSGPMSPGKYLWNTCTVSGTYPGYCYWACGNTGGLHINGGATQAHWVYVSSSGANEDMEIYVR